MKFIIFKYYDNESKLNEISDGNIAVGGGKIKK